MLRKARTERIVSHGWGRDTRLVLEELRESSRNKSAPSFGMWEFRRVFTPLRVTPFAGLQSHIPIFVINKSKSGQTSRLRDRLCSLHLLPCRERKRRMTPRFPNFFSPDEKAFQQKGHFCRASGSSGAFSKRRFGKRRRKAPVFVWLFLKISQCFFQSREGVLVLALPTGKRWEFPEFGETRRDGHGVGMQTPLFWVFFGCFFWVLPLPWDGGKEGSGPAKVAGVPCLAWEAPQRFPGGSRTRSQAPGRESNLGGSTASLQRESLPIPREWSEIPPSFPVIPRPGLSGQSTNGSVRGVGNRGAGAQGRNCCQLFPPVPEPSEAPVAAGRKEISLGSPGRREGTGGKRGADCGIPGWQHRTPASHPGPSGLRGLPEAQGCPFSPKRRH